jgi:hypothetical protein
MTDTGQGPTGGAPDSAQVDQRRQRVRQAVKAWTGQLIDLGGRNTLLYYKDLKQGTLDLGLADPVALDELLKSETVRLSNLFDPTAVEAAARRVRGIRAKANENFEERGLRTLFLGLGMATWTNTRGTSVPAAPVLLRLAHIIARGKAGDDFDLSLPGEWELNPTLLRLLATDYQVHVAADELVDLLDDEDTSTPDPKDVFDRLTAAASAAVPGFAITPRAVLGNFSYAKLPMVKDLEVAEELLVAHDLLSAIAGDEGARQSMRARHSEATIDEPDVIPPADEFIVLDADASQSYVINAAMQGGDLVVEGPPGTGKSQTIANLISTLAAHGQRVLFVAEKRAAIDAVLDRLNRVGLGDLVMDLHDATLSKRQLAQNISRTLAAASHIPLPDVSATHATLTARRETLRRRVQSLHAQRDPWGMSVYEAQSRTLAIQEDGHTAWRLAGDELKALDAASYAAAREELRDYAGLGGLTADADGPWHLARAAGAISSPDRAQAALASVSSLLNQTLPSSMAVLQRTAAECGLLAATTVSGWSAQLSLLAAVTTTVSTFDPSVFDAPLEQLATDLAPARRSAVGRLTAQLTKGRYRNAKKTVGALARHKSKASELLDAVTAAAAQRAQWRELTGRDERPRPPADLATASAALSQLEAEVDTVAGWTQRGDLAQLDTAALANDLQALVADQMTLAKLPELHRLETSLRGRHVGRLLDDLTARHVTGDIALQMLEHGWVSSILEYVALSDPQIGAFDGDAHRRTVAEFQAADAAHIESSAVRVRRAVAERITAARDAFPQESDVVEKQARLKQRHMPLRALFEQAPNVLGAVKPCWAMSPLLVAQLLPVRQCFDVVIFDEASQVMPADAVGALMRADRAVVAGDPHQLPPTSFFAASGGGEDDEDDEDTDTNATALTSDLESVLDVMAALLPAPVGTRTLAWHYRSRDERLIAFSNAQPNLYDWSLTTFPGAIGRNCIEHELVPFVAGRVGQEDSVADEVTRVVQLVQQHARTRPHESLGIITMGIKHANRIGEAIRRARLDDDVLDDFCDDEDAGAEPLFVKNLERVQGDERDAIILSIGYGKSADGRMLYRFGPLNNEGGERRLNVAITRARTRMTVVSSFSSTDMDPAKLRAEGAQMLARYLAYAESDGSDLGSVAQSKPELNPFERDVRDHLTAAGIPVIAQYGSSGYWIDYAAQHPTRPGEMVLALECDGATYHSSATARDRDRLRQQHLERLGWVFHRIWSSDWFHHREDQVERATVAYRAAVDGADGRRAAQQSNADAPAPPTPAAAPEATADATATMAPTPNPTVQEPAAPKRSRRPALPRGEPIAAYSHAQLVALIRWIESDTLLRTEEELVAEAMRELGFGRRGTKIQSALMAAIDDARAGPR